MGKKTNDTKPAAPARRAAKTKPAAEKAAPAKPAPARPSASARAPKTAPRGSSKSPFAQEDIALRAYFIAERRQAAGLPGDAHQDWIDAERQLSSEAKKTVAVKTKRRA